MSTSSRDPLAPLFLLAPSRSFTSLICGILGQHPQLYGLPELNLFMADTMNHFWQGSDADGSRKSIYWPMMRHGLLRAVAQLYAGEQTIDSIAMAYRWIRVRSGKTAGEVYRELAERLQPLQVVEKSPGYTRKPLYLQRLLATFPNARFIHLLRHPRGQAESMFKLRTGKMMLLLLNSIDYSGQTPELDPQVFWYESNAAILRFLERVPAENQMRVRGEDFIADLDGALRQVCCWLGISCTPEDLEAMKHPESSPFSCVGPATARLGNDINFLLDARIRPARASRHPLDGPLPWRTDGKGFSPKVLALADEFGYR
ncbi:MAG: sulfotransferase [Candidatus Competibacteraceae bacterium]|nr:sulfotransferase [Candidatus Competibacteraceae bacterium]